MSTSREESPRLRYGQVSGAADPELALRQLDRLREAAQEAGLDGELLAEQEHDGEPWRRLVRVLGASTVLGDHLVAHPAEWRCLAAAAPGPPYSGVTDIAGLRLSYRRALLPIVADDLTGASDVEQTMARLTALADATLGAASRMAATTVDGLPRLAVVAMGKCGGSELNYVSDVDVIFVAGDDSDLSEAAVVARRLMEICAQVAWPVDAALRPEGHHGPLVRTLASHLAYYRKWARTWEFQALLKARPAAGDTALAGEWLAALQPLIWVAAQRPEAVGDIRAMRARIVDSVPRREVDREIKRGPGGLRDIEFAVQLLQLVHGRGDESLRVTGTLPALRALVAGGYVGRADGDALIAAYRFLRTVEHRLQLQRLRRTHLVPTSPEALRWLAYALGYTSSARRDATEAFHADWVAHAGQVRRLHEKLLYRPLLEAVARVPTESLRMTPDAAGARLELLGFADPAGALRHLQALTGGLSRAAAIQRTLLPVLLEEFAAAPEPDRGLLAYRQVSETLGAVPWYLRLLRDAGPVAQRLARVLGLSRWCADLLARDPEALRLLADDDELVPRPAQVLRDGFAASAARHRPTPDGGGQAAVAAVRAQRRRELFRIACADVLSGSDLAPARPVDLAAVGQALADLTDATLAAALDVARAGAPQGLAFAVIGMGRLGGGEMGYSSDADVVFAYEAAAGMAEDEAATAAHLVAQRLRDLLAAPAPDPPLGVDADLRPEGRQGPLVRSLAAYQQYYGRWSRAWEAQALLRARFVAGDPDLGRRFIELADPVRYPAGGLRREQLVEIRRLKARVETERVPRGADSRTHTKLGPGGLADVEWTVQLLQLRHGAVEPSLRTTRTLPALDAAREAGLVDPADAVALAEGWTLAAQVRNALALVRGRAADEVPRHGPVLAGVVRVLGTDVPPGEFFDHYLKVTRRARAAVERVFQQ